MLSCAEPKTRGKWSTFSCHCLIREAIKLYYKAVALQPVQNKCASLVCPLPIMGCDTPVLPVSRLVPEIEKIG